MNTSKTTRLAQISDEVNELHPILDSLLPKLPNVLKVEYTHGPNEMGADFVIAQRNPNFKTTDYVGVVVKVGRIAQDFVDIERQIDECLTMPRLFMGGKEMIRISEVWVILTQHITGGAKSKIFEKYKSHRIYFIDGQSLASLIDEHLPVFWSDVSLKIGEYLSDLRIRNDEANKALSLFPVAEKLDFIH